MQLTGDDDSDDVLVHLRLVIVGMADEQEPVKGGTG